MLYPEKWVFIVGCYGSGTTLLNRMLAAHPKVGALPEEGQALTDQLPVPKQFGLGRRWALRPELFQLDENSPASARAEAIKQQWAKHFNHPHRPILIEKSVTNAARIRWLDKHFQPACFIAVIRNSYAVAASIRRHQPACPLEEAARQWRVANEIMLRDLARVERQYLVKYEDLTENPNHIWQRILDFIGLETPEWDISARTFQVNRHNSRITNMNARYIKLLSGRDRAVVTQHGGSLLEQFGYGIEEC